MVYKMRILEDCEDPGGLHNKDPWEILENGKDPGDLHDVDTWRRWRSLKHLWTGELFTLGLPAWDICLIGLESPDRLGLVKIL